MHFVSMSAASLAAVFAFSATTALAATYTIDGTGTGTTSPEVTQVTESLIVIKARTDYEGFQSDMADNPLSSLRGPCWGSVLVMDGKVDGGGLCNYTDADGDVAIFEWMATGMSADGRTTGDWEVKGGTGKWAAASGGGTFDGGTTTGSYTNNVTGQITMN